VNRVWPAIGVDFDLLATALRVVWTFEDLGLPAFGGRATTIWRVEAPGARRAGWRGCRAGLVAAMRMMLSFISKPSISDESAVSCVCSRSSSRRRGRRPGGAPTASDLVINDAVEFLLGLLRRGHARASADVPTNISDRSEP